MPPARSSVHMYTRALMRRNLTTGNVAEAFFRLWWAEKMAGARRIVLGQHGYNPDGIVEGRQKAKMLKRLPESPDFAVYLVGADGNPTGDPLAGISINSQANLYKMANARSPVHCVTCDRAARCHTAATTKDDTYGNLWFNRQNIENDYAVFTELSGAPVVLATIVARFPSSCQKIVADLFSDEAWALIHGRESDIDGARMQCSRTTCSSTEGGVGRDGGCTRCSGSSMRTCTHIGSHGPSPGHPSAVDCRVK